jgi:hypothetical protein
MKIFIICQNMSVLKSNLILKFELVFMKMKKLCSHFHKIPPDGPNKKPES